MKKVDGLLKKLLTLKTEPYLIVDKPIETSNVFQDKNKEKTVIHGYIVPFYPK